MAHGRGKALGRARAFTIIELVFVIAVIFLLMGLLIGGIKFATRGAKGAIDQATVASLKNGVTQFVQSFGSPPPLVRDGYATAFPGGPLNAGLTAPRVYSLVDPTELAFLKNTPAAPPGTADMRFSLYSLTFYIIGALDVDGVPGPGFRAVKRDGSFEKAGRTFEPFFDVSRNAKAVYETAPNTGKIELRDSRGIGFRYYRWVTGNANGQVTNLTELNVPAMVGNPGANSELKNAEYAIVAAGPDGLFGDEWLLPAGHPQTLTRAEVEAKLGVPSTTSDADLAAKAMADNIVGVGR
jgi:type II secretory pathway pseudopilin PulG